MTGDEEKKGDNDNQPASTSTSPSGPQHERQAQASLSRASSVATTGGGGGSDENDDASAFTNLSSSMPGSPNKTSMASSSASSVQVAVRVRPLLSALESGCGSCMRVLPPDPNSSHPNASTTIQIGASSTGPRFTFDEVFPTTSQQSEVFDHRVAPLVESCLQGYNASLVAYGQTGSGKTHTVIGPSTLHNTATGSDPADDPSSGMIPRAVHELFQKLQETLEQLQQSCSSGTGKSPEGATKSSSNASYEFEVRVQFLELYGEEIRDLLVATTSVSSSNNSSEVLRIRDIGNDEPEVVGATSEVVGSAEEALRCLTKGMLRRVTASTAMNEASSRSHAIFSIMIDQTWNSTNKSGTSDGTASNQNNNAAAETTGQEVRRSKFNFVDLAGSERQKRTQASGRRLKEGIDINKGLLVLGNVISALGDPKKRGKAFVPYRDSKLTRLLKGSLGGNHKTLMVACVSPASTNMEESLNCLRYANRAKNIQNHAVVNLDARSRQIAQLQQQVKALATDLLQEGNIAKSFTRQDLLAMVSGGASTGDIHAIGAVEAQQPAIQVNAAPTEAGPQLISPLAVQSPSQNTIAANSQDSVEQLQRLQDTEEELQRTRTQLKKSRRDNVAVEERLHVTQAEKEFYRLQLDAVTGPEEDDGNSATTTTTANTNGGTGETSTVKRKANLDRAFVDRASQYEKEIDRLKDELRAVRLQLVEQRDPTDDDNTMTALSIEMASQEMKVERERLSFLQAELLSASSGPNGTPFKSPTVAQGSQSIHRERRQDSKENDNDDDDHRDIRKVHSEDKAEEDHLSALTLKYSHVDDDDEVMVLNNQENTWVGDAGLSEEQREAKAAQQRRAQVEADLLEISRIIESKEDLISQLQCSQAKYSSMKEFYEGKLHQMEELLDKKEDERQKIIIELERLQENDHDTKEIEAKLKKQDEHIAGIRKQKRQLKDLTAVSSKNATEINKLQSDVKAMKTKKVTMQKQAAEERKAHATEMKRLKKEMAQKDRELRKLQKISNKKASEAEKANMMAHNKTAQLGQLRAKYKDAEKTIRMLQIKKGVMAKAGLDPVMVGRKEVAGDQSRNPAGDDRSLDMDLIRDYFDFKVAEVGRKESLADKLARGWESHFQLTLERSELAENDSEESQDAVQALDLRIQYEEERIRKLANRISKGQGHKNVKKGGSSQPNSILYGPEFKKLCKDVSPAKALEIASKVLFGMVVRERRRISSLAKTASALDEKLQECQMDNEAKEFAFRSYVQDSQQDLANISMNHQEQILALMSIVKSDKDPHSAESAAIMESAAPGGSVGLDLKESSDLLVLANERISVLEQQLRDMRAERKVCESYLQEKEEIQAALDAKNGECERVEMQCAGLRSTLRQIRSLLSDSKNDENTPLSEEVKIVFKTCLAVIRETLRESPHCASPMSRRHSCPNVFQVDSFSPRSRRRLDFVQAADDDPDEEDEPPDWAEEIMADLFLIAEGKLPPSLMNVPDMFNGGGTMDESKLSNAEPLVDNAVSEVEIDRTEPNPTTPPRHRTIEEDILVDAGALPWMDGSVKEPRGENVVNWVQPTVDFEPASTVEELGESGTRSDDQAAGKSVFDRLVNPTNFTGTQKEKHHGQVGIQKVHQESAAERLLDHLLDEEDGEQNRGRTAEAPNSNKVSEYTQQNVFERLQKTTTQSFAVKKHETNPAQPVTVTQKQKPDSTAKGTTKASIETSTKRNSATSVIQSASAETNKSGRGKARSTGIATSSSARSPSRQNDTPTRSRPSGIRAPQVRSPARANNVSPARSKSPPKVRAKEEYGQQNVFERLTKTTTEAFAVKQKRASKS